ncbi:hypothetical protein HDU98_012019 [Podochytrium sp. JEL0797]|nr:hypothetical protein HDU98_012019 [Podochytrium sp. JEL0797]
MTGRGSKHIQRTCTHCRGSESSCWRSGPTKELLCNRCWLAWKRGSVRLACGVQFAKQGRSRAVEEVPEAEPASAKKKLPPKRSHKKRKRLRKKPKAKQVQTKQRENIDNENDDEDDPNKVYCYCRKTYDPDLFYIQCDGCDEWYHGICANMSESDADRIFLWFCRLCERDSGRRPVFKKFCAAWVHGESYRQQQKSLREIYHSQIEVIRAAPPPSVSLVTSIPDSPTSVPGLDFFGSISDTPPADSPESPPPSPTSLPTLPKDDTSLPTLDLDDGVVSEIIDIETTSSAAPTPPLPRRVSLRHATGPTRIASKPAPPASTSAHTPSECSDSDNSDSEDPPTPPHLLQYLHTLDTTHILSSTYTTPSTCLKYLPDPAPPSTTTSTTSPTPTVSHALTSRYCTPDCGLSVSQHALDMHKGSLPRRVTVTPRMQAVLDRGEDLHSLEAFDALDSERLRGLCEERVEVRKRVEGWERGRWEVDVCAGRKGVVDWYVVGGEGGEEGKENCGQVVVGRGKRRKGGKEMGGEGEVGEEGVVGGWERKEVCGFDSRIVDVWFKAVDEGEVVAVLNDDAEESGGEEEEQGEDELKGLDLEALSGATCLEDVRNAVPETMCLVAAESCRCHGGWMQLKVEEAELRIEILMKRMSEIVAEESAIVERMRKRRALMGLTI